MHSLPFPVRCLGLTLALVSLPTPAQVVRHEFVSAAGPYVAERMLDGLSLPVAIEFLPDGRALVAQRRTGILTLADFRTRAKTDVENMPAPYLQGDGGDLYVIGLDGNRLTVHYQGACGSCPSSISGTLAGIENLLRQVEPEIEVIAA